MRNQTSGFTLLELLVVIAIIGILAAIVISSVSNARQGAFEAKAQQDMRNVHNALLLYQLNNGEFPPDADREVPSGLEQYLSGGAWPEAPWPRSMYDWDNWENPDEPGQKIYQISVRFCPLGDPTNCNFPEDSWANSFDYHSAVYYCIEGSCRAHVSRPVTHPAYCINCSN